MKPSCIIRKASFWVGILVIFTLNGCAPDAISSLKPKDTCWGDSEILSFEIEHTGGQFPLEIALLFTDDYAFSNIYLKLQVKGPEDWTFDDFQTETFIDPLGNWQMEQKGNAFPYLFTSFSDLELPQAGTYHFELSHFMRKDPLCGVKMVSAHIKSDQ